MTEPQQPQTTFQIEKIYVKDVSLEIPNAPQVFMQQAQPQLEVRLDTAAAAFAATSGASKSSLTDTGGTSTAPGHPPTTFTSLTPSIRALGLNLMTTKRPSRSMESTSRWSALIRMRPNSTRLSTESGGGP